MLKNVSPGLIENVKDLKISLNELTVYDFDVYSSIEVYYKIAHKLNDIIRELSRFEGLVSDEVIKQNNKLIYLLGEGLENEVIKEIDNLRNQNFFDDLVNVTLINNLNDRIDNIDSQLEQKPYKTEVNSLASSKAEKSYVDNLVKSLGSGSPKGVFNTLDELRSKYPGGNDNIYVVLSNGYWYYWGGSSWEKGTLYQSEGIADNSITSSKRTKLGNPCYLTFGNGALTPNIDTSNNTITFYANFYINVTNKRFVFNSENITISLEGTSTIKYILFDTDTSSFRCAAGSSEPTFKESEVLLMTISFANSKQIKNVDCSFVYTIDGCSSSFYFNNSILPTNLKTSIGEFAPLYVATSTDFPNFDTKSKIFSIDGKFFILSRRKRHEISSLRLDLTDLFKQSTAVAIHFDIKNETFTAGSPTLLSNLSDNSVLIALIYYSTTKIKSLYMNSLCTIDGEFQFVENTERIKNILEEKKYQFSCRDIVTKCSNSNYPGVGELDSPFNTENDNHELIYSLFDSFVDDKYVTRNTIGTVSNDIPIYEYVFNPIRPSNIPNLKPYPTILLGSAVHGQENLGVYTLYYFIKRMMEDIEDETLDYLKNNIIFRVIPLRNPIDFNNYDYVGSDDNTNINRNFDYNWDFDDDTKGSAPFSEVESQIQRDYMLKHKENALMQFDIHVRGGRQKVPNHQMMWLSASSDEQAQVCSNIIENLTGKWKKEHEGLDDSDLLGVVTTERSGGTLRCYSHFVVGIPCVTWEGFSASTGLSNVEDREVLNMNIDFLIHTIIYFIKYYSKYNN